MSQGASVPPILSDNTLYAYWLTPFFYPVELNKPSVAAGNRSSVIYSQEAVNRGLTSEAGSVASRGTSSGKTTRNKLLHLRQSGQRGGSGSVRPLGGTLCVNCFTISFAVISARMPGQRQAERPADAMDPTRAQHVSLVRTRKCTALQQH